ncbi:5-oxoprolinase subunit PxpA [Allomuricauda sp. R78024]|uniref:5-oxoprolinase subunit PxpA n=1 Tax=Allomuricauda sp. R78024 TaxID=3093867 RepID=UPI0037C8C39B
MGNWTVNINCDVGEGVGNEARLLPLIKSCNIACGGHAGDLESMTEVVKLAKIHNVKVGAHPSYPDKANFGREVMTISDSELRQSILNQLRTFDEVLKKEEIQLHHIKAHGALYNETAKNGKLAELYLDTIKDYKSKACLYVPYGSVIASIAAEKGFKLQYEAFGDRNYNKDLSLVSRKLDNALIQEPEKVLQHILPIIKERKVKVVTGEKIKIKAETICIHGDTSSALEILMYLSQELPTHR